MRVVLYILTDGVCVKEHKSILVIFMFYINYVVHFVLSLIVSLCKTYLNEIFNNQLNISSLNVFIYII